MVTQVNTKAAYLAPKTGCNKDPRRCASDSTLVRCRGAHWTTEAWSWQGYRGTQHVTSSLTFASA